MPKVVKAVETRLKAAGYMASDYELVIPPGKPDDGNIVARLKAQNPSKKPVLLLGHIDVVDAKREDWEREPFKLFEENGFFYGRGTADMKGRSRRLGRPAWCASSRRRTSAPRAT